MFHWLELRKPTAGGTGSIPGQQAEILQAARCSQKKKNEWLEQVDHVVSWVLSSIRGGMGELSDVIHLVGLNSSARSLWSLGACIAETAHFVIFLHELTPLHAIRAAPLKPQVLSAAFFPHQHKLEWDLQQREEEIARAAESSE